MQRWLQRFSFSFFAIAVVLILVIVPAMFYNIRRFREQEAMR